MRRHCKVTYSQGVLGPSDWATPWASYHIRKIAGCACAGNAGNDFLATDFKGKRLLTIPACITAHHVAWCMSGSLNPRWWGKRSRHSRRMRNRHVYVSGKRPMFLYVITIQIQVPLAPFCVVVSKDKLPCRQPADFDSAILSLTREILQKYLAFSLIWKQIECSLWKLMTNMMLPPQTWAKILLLNL